MSNEIDREIKQIQRGTHEIITLTELYQKLDRSKANNKPLIVKEGVDPTAPEIHLGHAVTLRKLRHLQDLGHDLKFLIGDFTARIGDPTGRSKTRKALTEADVLENSKTYTQQIYKILDPNKTEVVWNSHWLKPMVLEDFVNLLYRGTINEMVKRRSMAERLEKGDTVTAVEFIYPFLQGFDSVALNADIEVGGVDQYFNFVFTRDLQRTYGQEPQVAITMPLLIGTDGEEKMSKSVGNHIGINEPPKEMYAKVMSINDKIMFSWYELLTNVPMDELIALESAVLLGKANPKEAKMRLAREIVTQYHSTDEAIEAEREFERVHKYRELPKDIPEIKIHNQYVTENESKEMVANIVDLVVNSGYCKSKSDARRTIQHGGVSLDKEKIIDVNYQAKIKEAQLLQVGKRRFAVLKYEPK